MYTVSVCRRASGKGWRAVARYKDEDGWHNTTKSLRDARNKAEAIRMARDWEIELNGSSAATGPVVDYVAGYIDRKAALHSIQPSTATDYRKSLNGWRPYLDGLDLRDLAPRMLADALQDMMLGSSPTTVLKRYVLLKSVLDSAVMVGDLAKNPLDSVPRPRKAPQQQNPVVGEELERLKSLLPSLRLSPWVVGVHLCLFAGLRSEEACGLKVSDIDLDARVGWVRRAIACSNGHSYVAPTKNKRTRDFPICEVLADVLGRWTDGAPSWAWVLTRGERMPTGRSIGDRWSSFCELTELRGRDGRKPTLHDLRHTFATQCVAAGMDVKTLQSILGHSSAAMTLDIYASPDASAKAAASELIGNAI